MDIENMTIAAAKKAIEDGKAIETALGGNAIAKKCAGVGVANDMVGKYVIVRCRDAGVHAGVLKSYDGRACCLTDSRRLWRWRVPLGKSSFLSGVALYGVDGDSMLSDAVEQIALTENCEIIACSAAAEKSIREFATCTRTN